MSKNSYEIVALDAARSWDDAADVVIAVCGVAGLCAAIEARNAGVAVLVGWCNVIHTGRLIADTERAVNGLFACEFAQDLGNLSGLVERSQSP